MFKAGETCTTQSIKDVYINNGTGWKKDASWSLPLCFVNQNGDDEGTRTVDVNGDGLVDIIRSRDITSSTCLNTEKNAYINNGTGWVSNSTWNPPFCFTDVNLADFGTRTVDINSDGLVDIIQSRSNGVDCSTPSERNVFLNNGMGWANKSSSWLIPVCFIQDGVDVGTRLADVNGDGMVDIIRSRTLAVPPSEYCYSPSIVNEVYINNGTGWAKDASWKSPMCFVDNTPKDTGTRLADVNGDGLIDVIHSRVFASGTCTSPDEKGVYINNGTGWFADASWNEPLCNVDVNNDDEGTRLVDVNGDGLVDLIRSRGYSSSCSTPTIQDSYINNANRSYLMNRVLNPFGGSLTIDYKQSTSLDNKGNNNASDIGFNLWVVSLITHNNGMNGTSNVTSTYLYNYSGGLYDYGKREFRGFGYSEETRPDNTTIKHYFHQDDARTGREFKTETYSSNNLYQRKEFLWNFTSNNSYFITELREENASTFDGQSDNPKTSKTSYAYDSFGNTIQRISHGNINVTGDERYETFEYVQNTTAWIIGKVKHYVLLASNNATKVRKSIYTYDNLSFGTIPTKGSLTKEEDFIDAGNNATTKYIYDSHGNLISQIDPNSRTTIYTYGTVDTTFTYPDTKTNPKGHVTRYIYDLGIGKILSVTDSNGFVTNYTYDVFGRLEKEIRPFDSATYPTKKYTYELDGNAPEKVKVSLREQNTTNNTFDSWQFYDGFGDVIQAKTEAENSHQIVTDTFYDGMSRISLKSNPYKINTFDNYSEPNRTINSTNFTYDSLDRTIKITSPDSTKKLFNYTKWNVTTWDENWNKKVSVLDAYGQITKVQEFNGQEIYNTTYAYDASGSLTRITDNQGNNFTFAYDMLGRKTGMTDPDMGTWNYTYDQVGNLVRQKDSRNTTADFAYDELNRLTRRNSSTEFYNFTYDAALNGTLGSEQSGNYTVNYTYDARLRKTNETKAVNGNTTYMEYAYDSMDRVTSIRFSGNNAMNLSYNVQNRMEAIAGRLNDINYNELNNILGRSYNNSLLTNFTYTIDSLRLARITTGALQNLSYAYDNASNVISINDMVNSRFYTMLYDALNRLVYANRTDSNSVAYIFNYTYNSIGNLLKTGGTRNLEYSYGAKPAHAPSSIAVLDKLQVSSLDVVYENLSQRIFKFSIYNAGYDNITGINWTFDTEEANISSAFNITLKPGETSYVFVYYSYTSAGNYTINATARNDTLEGSRSIVVMVKNELYVDYLDIIYVNQTERVFKFVASNNGLRNLTNVNWTLNTGQANISSLYNITLNSGKAVFVFVYYNYTSVGTYAANATARNNTLVSSKSIQVDV